jgi:hypothetical protein
LPFTSPRNTPASHRRILINLCLVPAFLKATGTLLTFPATLRAAPGADLIQQQRLKMETQRIGSKASVKGLAEYFTGTSNIGDKTKAFTQ